MFCCVPAWRATFPSHYEGELHCVYVFLFCLCFLCLCSCFMCLCFVAYQLGELHFHRITRGNSIVCMFFCFVCVFCVCVRVLCVYVLVCTSLASYISIALREVTPLCVCFLFCLCFLCLCSFFMCLCFGVYQ